MDEKNDTDALMEFQSVETHKTLYHKITPISAQLWDSFSTKGSEIC